MRRLIARYALEHSDRYFETRCKQWVNQATVERGTLLSTPIPLAPLREEQRIVAQVAKIIERKTTARKRLLKLPGIIRQFRQSVLAKAFRGELTQRDRNDEPAKNLLERIGQLRQRKWEEDLRKRSKDPKKHKYKEPEFVTTSGLPKLPSGWNWATLEQIAFVERGRFSHRPRNAPQFYGGNHPFIQTGDIANAKGRIRLFKQTLNEKGFAISKLFPRGTIMVAIAANIGDSAILEFDACATDSVVGITCIEPILAEYVEYYMRTKKSDLENFAPATAQKNINLRILNPLPVPIAPLSEQRRIVARINELLANADLIEESVTVATANAETLEQSVLGRAFRGELLWGDPNDEPASVLLERIRAQHAIVGKNERKSETSLSSERSKFLSPQKRERRLV